MKYILKIVAVLALVYGMSGCSNSAPTLGVNGNGNCSNPKCKCAKPCQCKPVCTCSQTENLKRDKK